MTRRAARLASGACLALLAASPAMGQDARALLERVVADARTHAQARYAFTVDYRSDDGENAVAARLRYDPQAPEGERWRVLGAPQDDAPQNGEDDAGDGDDRDDAQEAEDARKAVAKLADKLEDAPRPDDVLLYDGLGDMLAEARLVQETDEEAIFEGPVRGEDAPKDALRFRLTLNKSGAYVSAIDVTAVESFKPMPVAKVTRFEQSQRFAAPASPGEPAFLVRSRSEAGGKAMFKSFEQNTEQRYSDIVPAAVAPDAPPN